MSFHKNISDLNVRVRSKRVPINMDTCYECLENVCFEPLLWLGFSYHLLELCHIVCSSLWNSNLLWRLHYHLLLDTFDKLQHDVLSCSLTCFLDIM